MLNKLLTKIFGTNKSLEKEQKKSFLCSINFELNHDGTINVLCSWPEFNTNNADSIPTVSGYFASLVNMLNHGLLEKDILETFNHLIDKDNVYDSIFILSVVNKISEYEETNKSITDGPIVKPSNVFKQYIER